MSSWICKHLALVAGLALLLVGLAVFGPWALEQLRGRERYRVPLAEIECVPPPGLSKADFLDEVQYLGSLPDQLEFLDRQLPARLAEAFAAHPWVACVDKVEVTPPRHIQVRLTFRTPALAVPVGGKLRVVDGDGVLLPLKAPATGLPRYAGQAPKPIGPTGTRWGDAGVEAVARRARQ